MELSLHANATTTPKTRAYIQRSRKSVAQLAAELGVSETTIYRWRSRTTVEDRSHRPKNLTTSLSAVEERAVCELRTSLQLPLDDIVEVMRRCINAKLSRSAIHRCLQRNGISRLAKPDKPKAGVFENASIGFIHIDVKYLPALQRRTSYAFVAIDRATRYVFVEVHSRRDGATATGFLKRFLADFPHQVHTILTENGAEFTDRFAVDKKNKPPGKPSGDHPFDQLCRQCAIQHRLTKPYHPQTNGLVERFNRRIAEAIGREHKRGSARRTFVNHADRDTFIAKFVHDYNRTRLKCLGYLAPIQALANHTGPNTFAGATAGKKHAQHSRPANPPLPNLALTSLPWPGTACGRCH
ncbi:MULTISPECIES: IS481 family transposase [Bradyrhizobium]|uniref:IS481 family transposase n=1 Tax=Bradyrhizobium brasilense TaxID=1419277 RepID=A0ABY8JQC7_9BRAD|nr:MULTISPECIES: IS481 family transposase [Bradyrhizobium]WFU66540.1 IS481 family transposase [Bradyrhizobium brasilense]